MQPRRQPRRRRATAPASWSTSGSAKCAAIRCAASSSADGRCRGAALRSRRRAPFSACAPRKPAHHSADGAGDDHRRVGRHPAVVAEDDEPGDRRQRRRRRSPRPRGASRRPGPSSRRQISLRQRRRAGAEKQRRREEVGECQKASAACKGREFYNLPMSVFALGLNHTTAPLDLRGRFALAPQQLASTLKAFRSRLERVEEVAIVSTCNRTEVYVGAPRERGRAGDGLARRHGRRADGDAALARLRARRPVGGAARVSRRQRPRFDGPRRAADPRPAEGSGARGRQRRHARQHAAADVPALVRGRQGSALVDRDRRALDQHGGGRGAPRRRSCSRTCARPRCCSSAPAR